MYVPQPELTDLLREVETVSFVMTSLKEQGPGLSGGVCVEK